MEIIIPERHPLGAKVVMYLETKLTALQRYQLAEQMEQHQQLSHHELLRKHKLEKLAAGVYEYRAPVSRANLRFFGKICGEFLFLLRIYLKKRRDLPQKEINLAVRDIQSITCEELEIHKS